MSLAREIKVWACPTCGYFRVGKTTGIHVATDPENPAGAMKSHFLVETVYVISDADRVRDHRRRHPDRVEAECFYANGAWWPIEDEEES